MMRILITRPQEKSNSIINALDAIGAKPILLPCIEFKRVQDTTSLDCALSRLNSYAWLVLTSSKTVQIVWERFAALGIDNLPADTCTASVGPKTAAALSMYGVDPDFVPNKYTAEEILPGLGDLKDRWVLLPAADIASDTLPKAIRNSDGIAHVVNAYHTIPATPNPEGLVALQRGVDVITFTSGSTVRNFISIVKNAGLDPLQLPSNPKFACIGPKTAKAANKAGLTTDIVAQESTIEGLVKSIEQHINNKQLSKK